MIGVTQIPLLRPGLLYALRQVLRLKAGGLLFMGIPCSLLVFISLATSKRGLHGHDIFGDESLDCVVKSNLHLSRACLLAMLCMARSVFWAAEQPSTSKLPQIPYYRELLSDPLLETYFTRLSGPQNLSVMISSGQLIR